MFNRRNAVIGYLVVKAVRRQARRAALARRRKMAAQARQLDPRDQAGVAAAWAIVVGVVIGLVAWLGTHRREGGPR